MIKEHFRVTYSTVNGACVQDNIEESLESTEQLKKLLESEGNDIIDLRLQILNHNGRCQTFAVYRREGEREK